MHQIVRLVGAMHGAFEVGAKIAILALDIEKVFDKLWVKGLVAKLMAAEFPNRLMPMIQSFLENQKFQVKINKSLRPSRYLCWYCTGGQY